MNKLQVYSVKGSKSQSIVLPKNWRGEVNMPLLTQALRVYENLKHPGLSKTKTRSEVSLTTKKVWRQKGTGRARHGARSAPIFVGGGTAHGPKGIKRKLTLPKKMRQKALTSAMSLKSKEGKIIVVNGISTLIKTKDAAGLISTIRQKEKAVSKKTRLTICLAKENSQALLALRNIKNINVLLFDQLSAYDVYYGGVLLIDSDAIKAKKVDKKTKKESNNK